MPSKMPPPPPTPERAREAIGQLTGAAQTRYSHTSASDPAAANAAAFGAEHTGFRVLCALCHVTVQPTQGGAASQQFLTQQPRLLPGPRGAGARWSRQHPVPRDAGPAECPF